MRPQSELLNPRKCIATFWLRTTPSTSLPRVNLNMLYVKFSCRLCGPHVFESSIRGVIHPNRSQGPIRDTREFRSIARPVFARCGTNSVAARSIFGIKPPSYAALHNFTTVSPAVGPLPAMILTKIQIQKIQITDSNSAVTTQYK